MADWTAILSQGMKEETGERVKRGRDNDGNAITVAEVKDEGATVLRYLPKQASTL